MAYENKGFTPAPRKKISLDNNKFNLNAPCPTAPGKTSAWTWGFHNNNPRITVYTRDPSETDARTGYGKIVANLDTPTLYAFFDLIDKAIKEQNGWKAKIENKNFIFPGGKRSEAPVVVSELWTGKDKDGCVWVSLTAKDRPLIKFVFGSTEYHNLYSGDGTMMDKAQVSVIYATGYLSFLRMVIAQTIVDEYKAPEENPKQGQGGNGGGGGWNKGGNGGGNGGGGNYNRQQADSAPPKASPGFDVGDDLPF